jgi:hypothetical protein
MHTPTHIRCQVMRHARQQRRRGPAKQQPRSGSASNVNGGWFLNNKNTNRPPNDMTATVFFAGEALPSDPLLALAALEASPAAAVRPSLLPFM